jgi:hypothetical protein
MGLKGIRLEYAEWIELPQESSLAERFNQYSGSIKYAGLLD